MHTLKCIFLLSLCYCASTKDCVYTLDGKTYDLNGAVDKMPNGGYASKDGLARMGMCGNNAAPCKGEKGVVAVFGDPNLSSCVVMLAKWDEKNLPKTGPLPSDSGDSSDGIQLTYETETCPGLGAGNYKVIVNFACDENTDFGPYTLSLTTPPCEFTANINTKYACPASSSGPAGLSGGWLFLIVLLSIFVLYLCGGVFYQYRYQEASGADLLPNKDIWSSFFSFVRIGFRVSMNVVRAKCGELCGGKDKSLTTQEEEQFDY